MNSATWFTADPLRGQGGTRLVDNLGEGFFWDSAERRTVSAVCFGLKAIPGSYALHIVKDLIGGWNR